MGMDTGRDIEGRVGPDIGDNDNMAKLGNSNVSTSRKECSFGFG